MEVIEKGINGNASKEWLEVVKLMDELVVKVETRALTGAEAYAKANSSVPLSALNALPASANPLRDQIAFAIRGLSITVWNKQEDIISSLALIEFCNHIQTSSAIRETLLHDENHLRQVEQKYRGILTCYFCETHSPDASSKIDTTIYLIKKRIYGIIRKVEYSFLPVSIPRCANCQKLHKKGRNSVRICVWTGAVLGLPVWGWGAIVGAIAGLIAGRQIQKKQYRRHNIKSASNNSLNGHPLLAPRIQEGWTLNKPAA